MTDTSPATDASTVTEIWDTLRRPVPTWFEDATFGIFIHWGAYSVPAWAEPSGALGAVPDEEWFAHNAYAEWYYNTIRIGGSPAAEHHRRVHGGAPYDDFLDRWRAENFDPAGWASLFRAAGAEYVIPTTKHHDGIALWDAPGTGTRNTVARGPERDLVGELADAVRQEGMRFGVYYSGGLDWSVTDLPPHRLQAEVSALRPRDAAYNAYAYLHVKDLIERYAPDVLWNDINWPDSGKRMGSLGLHELLSSFYAARPDGVINDRWGIPLSDFATSEYEFHLDNEDAAEWENCRGLGFSFGYNSVEDEAQTLSAGQLAKHYVDIVSRGGRLLLNVGPTAAGEIPAIQAATLRGFGDWSGGLRDHTVGAEKAPIAADDDGWARGWRSPAGLIVVTSGAEVRLSKSGATSVPPVLLSPGDVSNDASTLVVRADPSVDLPVALLFPAGSGEDRSS